MNWKLAILLTVFFGFGVCLVWIAAGSAFRRIRVLARGRRTTGVVVDAMRGERREALRNERHIKAGRRISGFKFVESRGGTHIRGPTYFIWDVVVQYEDAEGALRRASARASPRMGPYKPGDTVGIVYDSRDPSSILLNPNSFMELWWGPTLVGVLGVAFLIFGSLVLSGIIPVR